MNVRDFDLNLLRILIGIEETRSVSKAGGRLGLSQPASSNALARLRQALDDPLFVRTGTGMAPTEYAQRILPVIRQHLDGLDIALKREEPFDPLQSHRVFKLSLSGLGEAVFMPRLAISIMQTAPNVRIVNAAVPLSDLAGALERGEADIALGMLDVAERGVRARVLFDELFVAVAGKGLKVRPNRLAGLSKHKIVLPAPAATFGEDIGETLAKHGLADNVVLRLGHFGALIDLLQQLDVVAIVPREYARQLVAMRQAEDLGFTLSRRKAKINMIWHTRTDDDPGCVWLRNLVVELFEKRSG